MSDEDLENLTDEQIAEIQRLERAEQETLRQNKERRRQEAEEEARVEAEQAERERIETERQAERARLADDERAARAAREEISAMSDEDRAALSDDDWQRLQDQRDELDARADRLDDQYLQEGAEAERQLRGMSAEDFDALPEAEQERIALAVQRARDIREDRQKRNQTGIAQAPPDEGSALDRALRRDLPREAQDQLDDQRSERLARQMDRVRLAQERRRAREAREATATEATPAAEGDTTPEGTTPATTTPEGATPAGTTPGGTTPGGTAPPTTTPEGTQALQTGGTPGGTPAERSDRVEHALRRGRITRKTSDALTDLADVYDEADAVDRQRLREVARIRLAGYMVDLPDGRAVSPEIQDATRRMDIPVEFRESRTTLATLTQEVRAEGFLDDGADVSGLVLARWRAAKEFAPALTPAAFAQGIRDRHGSLRNWAIERRSLESDRVWNEGIIGGRAPGEKFSPRENFSFLNNKGESRSLSVGEEVRLPGNRRGRIDGVAARGEGGSSSRIVRVVSEGPNGTERVELFDANLLGEIRSIDEAGPRPKMLDRKKRQDRTQMTPAGRLAGIRTPKEKARDEGSRNSLRDLQDTVAPQADRNLLDLPRNTDEVSDKERARRITRLAQQLATEQGIAWPKKPADQRRLQKRLLANHVYHQDPDFAITVPYGSASGSAETENRVDVPSVGPNLDERAVVRIGSVVESEGDRDPWGEAVPELVLETFVVEREDGRFSTQARIMAFDENGELGGDPARAGVERGGLPVPARVEGGGAEAGGGLYESVNYDAFVLTMLPDGQVRLRNVADLRGSEAEHNFSAREVVNKGPAARAKIEDTELQWDQPERYWNNLAKKQRSPALTPRQAEALERGMVAQSMLASMPDSVTEDWGAADSDKLGRASQLARDLIDIDPDAPNALDDVKAALTRPEYGIEDADADRIAGQVLDVTQTVRRDVRERVRQQNAVAEAYAATQKRILKRRIDAGLFDPDPDAVRTRLAERLEVSDEAVEAAVPEEMDDYLKSQIARVFGERARRFGEPRGKARKDKKEADDALKDPELSDLDREKFTNQREEAVSAIARLNAEEQDFLAENPRFADVRTVEDIPEGSPLLTEAEEYARPRVRAKLEGKRDFELADFDRRMTESGDGDPFYMTDLSYLAERDLLPVTGRGLQATSLREEINELRRSTGTAFAGSFGQKEFVTRAEFEAMPRTMPLRRGTLPDGQEVELGDVIYDKKTGSPLGTIQSLAEGADGKVYALLRPVGQKSDFEGRQERERKLRFAPELLLDENGNRVISKRTIELWRQSIEAQGASEGDVDIEDLDVEGGMQKQGGPKRSNFGYWLNGQLNGPLPPDATPEQVRDREELQAGWDAIFREGSAWDPKHGPDEPLSFDLPYFEFTEEKRDVSGPRRVSGVFEEGAGVFKTKEGKDPWAVLVGSKGGARAPQRQRGVLFELGDDVEAGPNLEVENFAAVARERFDEALKNLVERKRALREQIDLEWQGGLGRLGEARNDAGIQSLRARYRNWTQAFDAAVTPDDLRDLLDRIKNDPDLNVSPAAIEKAKGDLTENFDKLGRAGSEYGRIKGALDLDSEAVRRGINERVMQRLRDAKPSDRQQQRRQRAATVRDREAPAATPATQPGTTTQTPASERAVADVPTARRVASATAASQSASDKFSRARDELDDFYTRLYDDGDEDVIERAAIAHGVGEDPETGKALQDWDWFDSEERDQLSEAIDVHRALENTLNESGDLDEEGMRRLGNYLRQYGVRGETAADELEAEFGRADRINPEAEIDGSKYDLAAENESIAQLSDQVRRINKGEMVDPDGTADGDTGETTLKRTAEATTPATTPAATPSTTPTTTPAATPTATTPAATQRTAPAGPSTEEIAQYLDNGQEIGADLAALGVDPELLGRLQGALNELDDASGLDDPAERSKRLAGARAKLLFTRRKAQDGASPEVEAVLERLDGLINDLPNNLEDSGPATPRGGRGRGRPSAPRKAAEKKRALEALGGVDDGDSDGQAILGLLSDDDYRAAIDEISDVNQRNQAARANGLLTVALREHANGNYTERDRALDAARDELAGFVKGRRGDAVPELLDRLMEMRAGLDRDDDPRYFGAQGAQGDVTDAGLDDALTGLDFYAEGIVPLPQPAKQRLDRAQRAFQAARDEPDPAARRALTEAGYFDLVAAIDANREAGGSDIAAEDLTKIAQQLDDDTFGSGGVDLRQRMGGEAPELPERPEPPEDRGRIGPAGSDAPAGGNPIATPDGEPTGTTLDDVIDEVRREASRAIAENSPAGDREAAVLDALDEAIQARRAARGRGNRPQDAPLNNDEIGYVLKDVMQDLRPDGQSKQDWVDSYRSDPEALAQLRDVVARYVPPRENARPIPDSFDVGMLDTEGAAQALMLNDADHPVVQRAMRSRIPDLLDADLDPNGGATEALDAPAFLSGFRELYGTGWPPGGASIRRPDDLTARAPSDDDDRLSADVFRGFEMGELDQANVDALAKSGTPDAAGVSYKKLGDADGAGVNDAYVATTPDGEQVLLKFDSPASIGSEIDAYEMMQAMRVPGAPEVFGDPQQGFLVSEWATDPQEEQFRPLWGLGDFVEKEPGLPDWDDVVFSDQAFDAILGAAVFDAVAKNSDRHPGNILMQQRDDGIWDAFPIDHGYAMDWSFLANEDLSPMDWVTPPGEAPFKSTGVQEMGKLLDRRTTQARLQQGRCAAAPHLLGRAHAHDLAGRRPRLERREHPIVHQREHRSLPSRPAGLRRHIP